jgi:hypothetical protein
MLFKIDGQKVAWECGTHCRRQRLSLDRLDQGAGLSHAVRQAPGTVEEKGLSFLVEGVTLQNK